jgi:hypothetical protein
VTGRPTLERGTWCMESCSRRKEEIELRRPVARGGARPALCIARAAALVSMVGVGCWGRLGRWPRGRPRRGWGGGGGWGGG